MNEDNISVIIPVKDYDYSLKFLLYCLYSQTILPKEIIIIHSGEGKTEYINKVIKNFTKLIKITYKKVSPLYPGTARNLGVKNCTENTLLFIDSKTVLSEGYLSEIFSLFNKSNYKVIFGKTVYLADSVKQKIIKAATFGSLGHETTPGTIINKDTFIEVGGFLEGVRTAEDLEWRARVKSKRLRHLCPDQPFLTYSEIPNSYKEMLSRSRNDPVLPLFNIPPFLFSSLMIDAKHRHDLNFDDLGHIDWDHFDANDFLSFG